MPTLVLDGGEVLIESTAILDYLDELVGPDKAMIARKRTGAPACVENMRAGSGLGDKAVSLIYERVLRKEQLQLWVERCQAQIGGVLEVLEKERAAVATPYWFGERIGHADIMVACALRFTGEAHPALFDGRALSGADGARRAMRGAAAISGDRAEARSAEGVRGEAPLLPLPPCGRGWRAARMRRDRRDTSRYATPSVHRIVRIRARASHAPG